MTKAIGSKTASKKWLNQGTNALGQGLALTLAVSSTV
jgi:hypothetical protein